VGVDRVVEVSECRIGNPGVRNVPQQANVFDVAVVQSNILLDERRILGPRVEVERIGLLGGAVDFNVVEGDVLDVLKTRNQAVQRPALTLVVDKAAWVLSRCKVRDGAWLR